MNGSTIPLQSLPSQHAPMPGASLPQSPTTNGNASSAPNQPRPPKTNLFLRILKNFTRTARSFSIRVLDISKLYLQVLANFIRAARSFPKLGLDISEYWIRPVLCLAVYGLTLYTAWSAPNQNALLGRVSPSLGNWILAVMAKAGDICFAFAVEDTFDTIAWRKLKDRAQNHGLVKLEWFLSVTSSTGIEGLWRLLWRRSRRWMMRIFERLWGSQGSPRSNEGVNASWERRWRDWWKDGTFSRWTFARLLFVAALIPGPGIILMADVDQATVFFDVKSMNVSAGVATFDPTIANITRNVIAPIVSRYIQTMLQDRSLSWPVEPIDPACGAGQNCNSYLIAGPYSTVSPWPFPRVNESNGTVGFRIMNAPFYQVDLWDASPETLAFSESRNCVVYGGLNATSDYSTRMCIAEQDTAGVLAAGWDSCQLGYSTANGSCLAPGGGEDWATFLRFYRRNATLVFSRSSLEILDVSDMSDPQPQKITSAALFTALDAILYRPDRADDSLKFYDIRSAEYLLTQTIGVQLWSSLFNNTAGLNIGRDWLRNLVPLPVYIYQPTYLELAPYFHPLTADNGTAPQPNLPAENYVEGSYCVVDKRSIPGRGTVYAYAAVAGLLLTFVIIAKIRALRWKDVATSDFAVLDYHVLTKVVGERGDEVLLRDKLEAAGDDYGTGAMLNQISDLRIGLR